MNLITNEDREDNEDGRNHQIFGSSLLQPLPSERNNTEESEDIESKDWEDSYESEDREGGEDIEESDD